MNDNKLITVYTLLVGVVEPKSVREVMKDIDQANAHEKEVKRVMLTIMSPGGWLYDGFALYDHIKASSVPVDIIAEGYCASSALMIMQAGRKRIARPHTSFMVHPSSHRQEESEPYEEFLSIVEQYKRNHDLFVKLTIERSKMDRKQFEALYEPRKYLSPEEALKLGFIDEILSQ